VNFQKKLYDKVDASTVDTFPRTLMLLGEHGCGKRILIKYICDKFAFENEDISDKLSLEYIEEINQRVHPYIYTIDCSKLTVKNENVILKFLEEPLKNSFIILMADNKYSIIPTVLNRCQVWEFESYPQEYLDEMIAYCGYPKNDIIAEVANTPGKIVEYKNYPMKDMVELATKIFNSMAVANFANVMTLSRFIAFKNEKDKYDFNLFLSILLAVSNRRCKSGEPKCYEMYSLTRDLNTNKYVFNVDKKALFEKYLIELKILADRRDDNV
jgi:hypothetical protein